MSFSRGDDPDCVRENRRRFLSELGILPGAVAVGQQVHGNRVERVGLQDAGRGAIDPSSVIPSSDGLVTTDPGVFLISFSADCPLIALLAPPDRGVALAHCGWRGVATGMPGAAVEALERATGAGAEEFLAVIGPSIGPCCYQVGEDVMERLPPGARRASRPREEGRKTSPGENGAKKYLLDLSRGIRNLLEEAGMNPNRIEASPLCSSCNAEDFFSHRRDGGATGRIAMVMGIRPGQ